MVQVQLESLDVCFAAVAIVGMIVAALSLRGRYRSLDTLDKPRPPWPAPSRPSCPICGEPMERLAAILEDDAWAFAERGLPAPDYFCPRPSCHDAGGGVVYCYAVNPGEPVRLGPAKPAPEEEVR